MEDVLQNMTTNVSPLLKVLAPEAFDNMVSSTLQTFPGLKSGVFLLLNVLAS